MAFTDNQVTDGKGVGLVVESGAEGVFTGNTITSNAKGDLQVCLCVPPPRGWWPVRPWGR